MTGGGAGAGVVKRRPYVGPGGKAGLGFVTCGHGGGGAGAGVVKRPPLRRTEGRDWLLSRVATAASFERRR